jgi:hypothetical protein
MAGVLQLMEKSCLEVTEVQHYTKLILKHLKVSLSNQMLFVSFHHYMSEAPFLINFISLHFNETYTSFFNVAVSKQVVFYKGHQVHNLNELEYINGEVWANVFTVCLCMINYDVSWGKYIFSKQCEKQRQILAMYV